MKEEFDPSHLHGMLSDEAGMRPSRYIEEYLEAWEKCKSDPGCMGLVILKRRGTVRLPRPDDLASKFKELPDHLKAKTAETREEPKTKHNPRPNRMAFLDGLGNRKRKF